MARTTLEGRNALILGVETALGRASALQLSRAGMKVVLASTNAAKATDLAQQLKKKGADTTVWHLPRNVDALRTELVRARDQMGHLHCVLNALAFSWENDEQAAAAPDFARAADALCGELLVPHGPTRLLTLWPAEVPTPEPVVPSAWHCHVVLGPRQRLDTESVADLDKPDGPIHLRSGGVADSVVFLFQLPPSTRPTTVRLDGIPSIEKKGA